MVEASAADYQQIELPKRPKRINGWLLFLGDVLAIGLAWYCSCYLYFKIPVYTLYVGPNNIGVIELVSAERFFVLGAMLVYFHRNGQYTDHMHYLLQLKTIAIGCVLALIGESVIRLFLDRPTSSEGLLIAWGLTFALLCHLRIAANFIATTLLNSRQGVIVLSETMLGKHVLDAIARKPSLGYCSVAGDFPSFSHPSFDAKDVIQGGDDKALDDLREAAARTPDDTLFLFAFENFNQDTVPNALQNLESLKRPFGIITSQTGIRLPDFREFPFYGEDIILLLPHPKKLPIVGLALKRAFDVVASSLLLVALSPLLLFIIYLIKKDGGPALYSQPRLGKDGRHFECFKFRSMVVDADELLENLLESDADLRAYWQAHQKLPEDPRITGIGSWLRKSSMDELPQLINVLRGEMSIVGPRPCLPDQANRYGRRFTKYLRVRPGITGLWQVSGRNKTTFEERVELEAWYVDNWSVWLDIFILFKTVPVVLFRSGAH